MKIAALDLGTNTFLCLIAEGNKDGIVKVHKDLMQVVRLGQGIDKTGQFHPDALTRAKACLTEFKKEIDHENVERILAMATSAARDAQNGSELFKIGESLGIPIEIIPGEDEARITYQGATVGLKSSPKNVSLVIDVGGGSTELIVGRGDQIIFSQSLNLGGVRLTERFVSDQPVSFDQQQALKKHIAEQISQILPDLKKNPIEQVIAVAGTPTSLVALEIGGFDDKKVDGYFLTKERLEYWVQEFAKTSVEFKRAQYQLGERADIIYAGALILLSTLEALGLSGMTVSTKGVRYGVALELLRR